jgi:hypothetical protein
MMTEQETIKLKHEYAANLLRTNDDPFKAGFATTPNTGIALQMARDWPNDPVVLAAKAKLLLSEGAKTYLPTKEVQAKDIYAIATDSKYAVDDRLKAHRLYAEVMSYIEKPNAGATTNILNQGVLIVKDQGSDEEWQAKANKQQQTLIGNA